MLSNGLESVYYDPQGVDWSQVRTEVMQAVTAAPGKEAAHERLQTLFGPTGPLDGHSMFFLPNQELPVPTNQEPPTGERIADNIGYLHLPIVSTQGDHSADYASTLQGLAQDMDDPAVCGWMIDLRDEQGGNMWPVLLGVGPLLGGGDVLAFAKTASDPTGWVSYADGRLFVDGESFGSDTFRVASPFDPA